MFPFNNKKTAQTLTCLHVMVDEKPILYASHDEDGLWQFLCGEDDSDDDALILSLNELYVHDKTIAKLCDMPIGYFATRSSIDDEWEMFQDII